MVSLYRRLWLDGNGGGGGCAGGGGRGGGRLKTVFCVTDQEYFGGGCICLLTCDCDGDVKSLLSSIIHSMYKGC